MPKKTQYYAVIDRPTRAPVVNQMTSERTADQLVQALSERMQSGKPLFFTTHDGASEAVFFEPGTRLTVLTAKQAEARKEAGEAAQRQAQLANLPPMIGRA